MGNTFASRKNKYFVVEHLPTKGSMDSDENFRIMDPDVYRWRREVLPSCHAALRMTMLALNVMPWEEGTPDTFVPWDALENLICRTHLPP